MARSAKWGTTEPSGRPSPSRQGSQGSGQLEALGSAGSGVLPSRPPMSGILDSPRPTKLDALLHAQQLAQQQQQQQQHQQHSGSSSHEGRPGAAGLASRRALSGQLPATQSAAQFGINTAQVMTSLFENYSSYHAISSSQPSFPVMLLMPIAVPLEGPLVDARPSAHRAQ